MQQFQSDAKQHGEILGEHIYRLFMNQLGELVEGANGVLPASSSGLYDLLRQVQADNQLLRQQVNELRTGWLAQGVGDNNGSGSTNSETGVGAGSTGDSAGTVTDDSLGASDTASDYQVVTTGGKSEVKIKAKVVRIES